MKHFNAQTSSEGYRLSFNDPLAPVNVDSTLSSHAGSALRAGVTHWRHCVRVSVIATALCAVFLPCSAQDIGWRKLHLDLRASNEPLNSFLGRVLALSGIAATMSPPIASARVNGRLEGSAESIFRELVDTYGLTWYHDGSMLYVYSLAELESRMLQVAPADLPRVERTLREMRMLDPRYPLKSSASEGRLLVTGPPQYVQMVSDVAAGVAQAPGQNARQIDVRVFRLRHARAADTVVSIAGSETSIPGVARILNETLGSSRIEATASPSRMLPVSVSGLRGKGQLAIGRSSAGSSSNSNSNSPSTDGRTGDSSETGASGNEQQLFSAGSDTTQLNSRSTNPAPAGNDNVGVASAGGRQRSALDGIVRADPRINAVVVRDTLDRMPLYARLINELDVTMPLLEIEATVIDVSRDKSEQLGIDWRLHGPRADIVSSPNSLAGQPGDGVGTGNLRFALPAQSSGGAGFIGTLLFGSERTNFLARINALAANGDANLVSKPRVLTLDNTEAVLQSTQDFYVRVAGRDQVDLFNVSLGLVLRVTPTVIEGLQGTQVKLNIRIEDGNTSSGTQVDQIPVVSRNAISTQAIVGDGHSLLIGGYTIDEKTRNASGVPVLSEIPGLRWLFGQKSSSSRQVERIFMITPRLVPPADVRGDAATVSSTPPPITAVALEQGDLP